MTIYSCKTKQNEKTEPNTNPPKVEFSEYDLGKSDLPKLKREVNDFEFIFTLEQLEKLTLIIRDFEKNSSNQIAIVSIDSIRNYTDFDKFAVDLSNYNGIGLKVSRPEIWLQVKIEFTLIIYIPYLVFYNLKISVILFHCIN
ncbi:hypothetical protein GCM10022291_07650 [Postechiella marina]|uniref:TPM domain-containing protein n=1 Tax=Postechiella marina TaxID=943941 RepID=A0ABP8C2X3_9FLAO